MNLISILNERYRIITTGSIMNNIHPQQFQLSRSDRNLKNGHASFVVWFTGLSGSGKSTLSSEVEKRLFEKGVQTFSLDGDNIRGGLNRDLGFEREDREENLRRVAEVSKLFIESGSVVLASFISPLQTDRKLVRNIIGARDFFEIYVNASLAACEKRDIKGLYKKARAGEIKNFTGVSAPYEPPTSADLEIMTDFDPEKNAVERIVKFLSAKLEIENE